MSSFREDMLPHASVILERILKCNLKENPNTLIRKLALKLVQRLGLIFLKSRIAAWRYQRGSRSLTINLSLETPNQAQPKVVNPQEEEDDYDVPEEIEDVIEELLNGLRDPETVVRWTSAKGEYILLVENQLVKSFKSQSLTFLMRYRWRSRREANKYCEYSDHLEQIVLAKIVFLKNIIVL